MYTLDQHIIDHEILGIASGGTGFTGSGTLNFLAKFTPSGTALGDSLASDDGASFQVIAANGASSAGNITMQSGSTTGTGNAGFFALAAGSALLTGDGGSFGLAAGDGGVLAGSGGTLTLAAGTAQGSGNGGSVFISAGDNAGAQSGGTLTLNAGGIGPAGAGSGGSAGNMVFRIKAGDGAGAAGQYRFYGSPNTFYGILSFESVSADRTYTFPNASGTIALTSDLSSYQPLDTDLTEIAALANVRGDLLYTDSGPNWARLAIGSANKILASDGTDVSWSNSLTPTMSGVWTFSAQDVHNAGVSLGTDGTLTSAVADGIGVVGIKYKPSIALTSDNTRFIHSFQTSTGVVGLTMKGDLTWEFGGSGTSGGYINVGASLTSTSALNYGISFIPPILGPGGSILNTGWTGVAGAFFAPKDDATATYDTIIGGVFAPQNIPARNHARIIGGLFSLQLPSAGAATQTDEWGWWITGPGTHIGTANRTITNLGGGYIPLLHTSAAGTNKPNVQNLYGIFIEEQKNAVTINNGMFFANATSGYKAIAIRDQNAWIGSNAAGELTIGGTNCRLITTNIGFFGVAAVARPGAFTQTYATATHTHSNPTATTIATTAATNVAPFGYTTAAQADAIVAAVNALIVDVANTKQVLNAAIDDGQSLGLLQ